MGGYKTKEEKELAIVVGISTGKTPAKVTLVHLEELTRLAQTAGAEVVGQVFQRRATFDARTLIGSGKIEELAEKVKETCAGLVIFDDDLTGSQAKTIEALLPNVKVLDRSGLILDIFANTAKTSEAKFQVELAQLEYYLPRLTHAWTHLSRQAGGIGLRGPGETQLEVDRRLVRKRISDLKKRLKKIEAIKQHQHERRYPTFHVSLVGYTNAGKSSLMNLLTKANVGVEDKLFATLDATTRKLHLGSEAQAVLSDTVGFIRKLPHNLIESFKSTLSVVRESTLILNVIDGSNPDCKTQMKVTADVLSNLETDNIPRIMVINKIDLMEFNDIELLRLDFPKAVFVSAHQEMGIALLKNNIKYYYDAHVINYGLEKQGATDQW